MYRDTERGHCIAFCNDPRHGYAASLTINTRTSQSSVWTEDEKKNLLCQVALDVTICG